MLLGERQAITGKRATTAPLYLVGPCPYNHSYRKQEGTLTMATSKPSEDKRPVGRPPAPYPRVDATFEDVIKALVKPVKPPSG